jgi:hypothetical protein
VDPDPGDCFVHELGPVAVRREGVAVRHVLAGSGGHSAHLLGAAGLQILERDAALLDLLHELLVLRWDAPNALLVAVDAGGSHLDRIRRTPLGADGEGRHDETEKECEYAHAPDVTRPAPTPSTRFRPHAL